MEGGGCNSGGIAIDDDRPMVPACTASPAFPGSSGQNTDAFMTAYGAGFGGPTRLAS